MPEHYSRGPRAARQISPRARAMAAVGLAGGRITAGAGSNLLGQQAVDRNQDATLYVGNLDPQVSTGAREKSARKPSDLPLLVRLGAVVPSR